MSKSLQPHGLQHASLPRSSPTLRTYLNSCVSSQWCHPIISTSVVPFSSPASNLSQHQVFFTSGGQKIGASASASVLPTNSQDWFLLGLTGLISLQSKGLSRVFSRATVQRHQFFSAWLSLWSLSHPYMTTEKTIAFPRGTFVNKVMSLLFKMLSRFVIAFLPRSKHLLVSWLQSPSAVIFGAQENKVCFHCFPIYLPWSRGTGCHDPSFLNVAF